MRQSRWLILRGRRGWLAAGIVVLATLVSLARLPWLNGPAPAYRVAVRLVLSGELDERAYDDAWFGARVLEETGGAFSDILSPTPPTLPLLVLPLGWLFGEGLPSLGWAALNLLALYAAIWLVRAALRPEGDDLAYAVLVAVVLLSAPFRANLHRGQIFVFVLLLHALVFWGALRRRDTPAGIALGLLLAAKINGLPLWILLLALRRWRLLASAAITVAVVVVLTIPLLGVDIWRVYLTKTIPAYSTSPIAAVPAYQTLGGFFQHFFRYDATWNQAPLLDVPWLARLGTLAASVALVGLTLLRRSQLPASHLLAAGVVLSVVTSPLGEQHHYLMLVVPFAVAVAALPRLALPQRALLVASAAMVAVPLPYMSERWWAGAFAVLVYPRLYGALLLWGVLLLPDLFAARQPWRRREQSSALA
ncbi:MAG TPA: glycosyltransferase 87 family protein [Ardenticatenaceae bacterium]|nr:glycosyltransferase 87 family protein [Ardenticatenaceae bacterium]